MNGVHPRVCGEASAAQAAPPAPRGPSPRVRGSLGEAVRRDGPDGSIPACAGKPRRSGLFRAVSGVHPRVCGEAALGVPDCVIICGPSPRPSPRVRGSRVVPDGEVERLRSIPACAGKPRGWAPPMPSPRVHPRVCGEADIVIDPELSYTGPSPRVRGSRDGRRRGDQGPGSIPACAGKPRRSRLLNPPSIEKEGSHARHRHRI